METLSPTLVIIIGLALRVLVPLALTVLVVYLLRKLDARWQAEARNEEKLPAEDEMPCLEIQGLTEEQIKARLSMKAQPCWLARRLPKDASIRDRLRQAETQATQIRLLSPR